VILLYRCKNSH